MAKVKVRREGNLLWEDECQPLTNEQMTDIKSQFHPSNTANVNIVPYHIYDEDGEERIVGEVRKTIDGVKKSKPLYEKIVSTTSPSTKNSWTNLYTMTGVTFTDLTKGFLKPSSGASSNISHKLPYSIAMTIGISGDTVKTYISEDWCLNQPVTLTVQYTKDSDTWQPV